MPRTLILALVTLVLSTICISASYAVVSVPQSGSIEIVLKEIASGFDSVPAQVTPTKLVPFPDDSGRFLVGTLGGNIEILHGNGSQSTYLTQAETENVLQPQHGLSSIAFHPDFANIGAAGFGKFYTITSEDNLATQAEDLVAVDFGTPDQVFHDQDGDGNTFEHHDVIREWSVSNISSNVYDGTASREILRVAQPGNFHNITDMAFDADGMLYITSGDGGGGPVTPPAFGNSPGTRRDRVYAQDLGKIYGKVLRIDPLDPSGFNDTQLAANGLIRSANGSYAIPDDNPFTSNTGALDEIFAYGVRSPYRLTIDHVTGDIYLGDVGNQEREEINRIVAGANYGWSICEGSHDYDGDCSATPDLTAPVIEYERGQAGRTVVGGFIYRGTQIPDLQGKYVFADFFTDQFDALYYADLDTGDLFRFAISTDSDTFDFGGTYPNFVFGVGQDLDNELYLVAGPGAGFGSAESGHVIRIRAPVTTGDVDGDGDADGFDFLELQRGFGVLYDSSDITNWETNYGTPLSAVAAAVPEPSALFLMLMASFCVFSRREG